MPLIAGVEYDIDTIVDFAVSRFQDPHAWGENPPTIEGAIHQAVYRILPTLQIYDMTSATVVENWSGATFRQICQAVDRATRIPALLEPEVIQQNTIFNPDIDGSWWPNLEEKPQWNRLLEYWQNPYTSTIPINAATNIGRIGDEILSHSWNPREINEFLWKGLVVGNVQSGKTATYTGLISKSVDAGYRVIVVVTGLLDALRAQTQGRIVREFIGSTRLNGTIEPIEPNPFLQLTSYTPGEKGGDFDRGSESVQASAMSMLNNDSAVMIAVVKKNSHILRGLNSFFEDCIDYDEKIRDLPILIIDDESDQASPDAGAGEEPRAISRQLGRMMHPDYFRKRMYIGFTATPYTPCLVERRDLENPEALELYGPDIYPSDYILVMPDQPESGYCGGEIFVGRTEVNINPEIHENLHPDAALYLEPFEPPGGIMQYIPEVNRCELCGNEQLPFAELGDGNWTYRRTHGQQGKRKFHFWRDGWHNERTRRDEGFNSCECICHQQDEVHLICPVGNHIIPPLMTPSLEQAVDDYILAGSAMAQRGFGHRPCTMLVNVHHQSEMHINMRDLIYDHISEIEEVLAGDFSHTVYNRLENRWNNSFRASIRFFDSGDDEDENRTIDGAGWSSEIPNREFIRDGRPRDVEFDQIREYIVPFIEQIEHRVLNKDSPDTLDFDQEPNLKAIVHGGYSLGRGLTFKGLATVYMLRKPGDITALIQIQRWCGYRYEENESILDLMRVYMTEEQQRQMQRMMAITKVNRQVLSSYALQDFTPDQIAPLFQQDPSFKLVSHAYARHQIDWISLYGGSEKTQRTFRFDTNDSEENRIFLAGDDENQGWLDRIDEFRDIHNVPDHHLKYSNVNSQLILDLIEHWDMIDTNQSKKYLIRNYIQRMNASDELQQWTVYVPGRGDGNYLIPVRDDAVNQIEIDLGGGRTFRPFARPLETDNRFQTISEQAYRRVDFNPPSDRPPTHGLLVIYPILHPGNRLGHRYSGFGPNLSAEDGLWPSILGISFSFPTTNSINEQTVGPNWAQN